MDWEDVSSNLERLPYYARRLELGTQKCVPIPVNDESLFLFANEPDWKEKLDSTMISRMTKLIADYEEALRRCRYLHIDTEYMTRKTDSGRILYARGQEQEYSVDELCITPLTVYLRKICAEQEIGFGMLTIILLYRCFVRHI